MKIRYKRIMGLFAFVFITYMTSIMPVSAAYSCDGKDLYLKYGLSISTDGHDNYTLSVDPKTNFKDKLEDLRKTVFTIQSVNYTIGFGGELYYGHDLTFHYPTDDGIVKVWLSTADGGKNNDPDCKNGDIELQAYISSSCPAGGCEAVMYDETSSIEGTSMCYADASTNPDGEDTFSISTSKIDCTNYNRDNPTSFEDKFCYAKDRAKANGKSYDLQGATKMGEDQKQVLWCGIEFCDEASDKDHCVPTDTSIKMKTEASEEDEYYTNKDYFHATTIITKDPPKYVYNYAPGDVEGSPEATGCKVECEESVVAEYGPPVATKAGLCFEYKVKVTSRVSCEMKDKPSKPKYVSLDENGCVPKIVNVSAPYCVPAPNCMDSGGGGSYSGYNEGGPNEEFDYCVKQCDGGKYTDKCSKKCYKEVYGNKTVKKQSNVDLSYAAVEKLAQNSYDLDECVEKSPTFDYTQLNDGTSTGVYKGCYWWDAGRINWKGDIVSKESKHDAAPGRWYAVGSHKYLGEYKVFASDKIAGFYRHVYADGSVCNDICVWQGCNTGKYLNPGQAEEDAQKNLEEYKSKLQECMNAASCNTSTAEFTISAEYSEQGKETEYQEVYFPYTSPGTAKTSEKLNNDKCKTSNQLANNTTILQYGGCYMNQCNPYIWYMTEWSFPGAWINNKTGEVSFDPQPEGWQEVEKKFCTPRTTANVNQEWWNYYYHKVLVTKNETSVERSDFNFEQECGNGESGTVKNTSTVTKPAKNSDDNDTKWNIHANAHNFGYFQWDITMNCFYAINNTPSRSKRTGTKELENSPNADNCIGSSDNYTIRPVQLDDLFPSPDGTEKTGSTETGRAPGFNWTKYAQPGGADGLTTTAGSGGAGGASQPAAVNQMTAISASNYNIEPEEYIKTVQQLADTVYSERYLDYYFELTPKELNELKDDLKNGKKFNTFGKDSEFQGGKDNNSIIYYHSDVIDKYTTARPKGKEVLSCNNIKNYKSSECED